MTSPTVADRARIAVERFSLRNLTYALGAAVLLAGLGAMVTLRAPAEYRSAAVLLIDSPLALATAGDDSTVNKLQQLRGKYATLANTEAIAGPVADALGLRFDEVIRRTDVHPAAATLTLVVTARGGDAEGTTELAAAMAREVGAFVEREHEDNEVPAADRFEIEVVSDASPAARTSPSSERAVSVAGIAFAVTLALAYLALQLVRPPVPPGGRLPRPDEVVGPR